MTIENDDAYFDDPVNIESKRNIRGIPGALASILILIVGSLFLDSTLAGSISLNSNKVLEFGQGIAQTTTCDNSLTLTPLGSFTNASGAGSFTFTGISISNLDTRVQGCAGETLSMSAYGQTGNALNSFSIAIASDGTFTSSEGSISNAGAQGSISNVTLTFSSPTVNSTAVYKITIQSSLSAPPALGSIYLNNTYFSTPYSANMDVGTTGAFTLEMWAKPTTSNNSQGLYTGGQSGGQLGFLDINCGASDKMFIGVWGESCNGLSSSSQYPTINQWNHVVLERDGSNNNSVYLNGSRVIYTNGAIKLGLNGANNFIIGQIERGSFTGYISNFRLVRGSAIYSGTSITVPTSPLTLSPASGTVRSLLLMKTEAGLFADETGAQTFTSPGT
ncbi:MAG: hypothetical protein F2593_03310, partial [Actinobacteria bacterium]|nr:hypothetical protein [Actinomycetota bacterium]